MKAIFTLACFLIIALCSSAQTIEAVTYRGAFAPAPTPMWTTGWVNWDPQTTNYAAPTVTVSGNITANTTWTSNNTYQLNGIVYVDSLVTLTIEPGTVIRGSSTATNSSLLIKRGAKLIAQGTSCNPIVFTSGLAAGSRSRGDWGGLIILGRAQNNLNGGVGFIEGLTQGPQNAHGGTDNADNSGILKYVRIEFSGFNFANNNEINGLTMGSVGSGTKIDYVQTSFIQDDGFEWFGGNVNCSHLVSYQNLDDDFDTDNGFSGKVQFGLIVRDPDTADNPTISTSEGFESDNDANGSTATPQTSAVFSNITAIGPYRGNSAASVNPGFRRGARIRRNSALKIFNSIFMDYSVGLFLDGTGSQASAGYKNNIVALAPTQPFGGHRVAEDAGTRTVFFDAANSNDSLGTSAGILITPYEFSAPDYRPAAGSPALTNYNFSDPALPVTLVKFNGQTINGQHILSWQTATEVNNSGFYLERSQDGNYFSSISFIPTKALNGNSTLNLHYSFIDLKAPDGKIYYRLNQVDNDGKSKLSSVLVLSKITARMLEVTAIYPNPVRDQLSLAVASPSSEKVTVAINDVTGKIVYQKVVSVAAGSTVYNLNIKSFSPGSYFVKISIDKGNQKPIVKSFLKQ
jgi:hypothetical protein